MLECAKESSPSPAQSPKSFQALPQDDPARRRPDITKARTLLGWEPKVALREGLQKSLAYFQACIAANPNP
jgi:dTDP-glucose 4,6-dehydratase